MRAAEMPPQKTLDQMRVANSRLRDYAEILMPEEAESPILAPSVRAALFDWMTEIRSVDDLEAMGLKPRRTALLYGPPGCGKTTFAHHFAARLGLPLALVRSESLIASYLGETGRNLGKLFDAMAETEGQVVIFFDEVDALGGKRMNDQGASVERANSLNVLLRRIERFKGISLAATNRHDMLDAALWRRFDMQIKVELPGEEERFAILRRYLAPLDPPDDDVDILAGMTAGASPALLRGVAEGIKRAIVMNGRLNRPSDPARLVTMVAGAVAPPPEIDKPPLWAEPDRYQHLLASFAWPWPRLEKPEAA